MTRFCQPIFFSLSFSHNLWLSRTHKPNQSINQSNKQSTWNRDNRFIGWHDTPLTDDGVLEARVAGRMLQESGMRFDEVHTSLLRRSIRTCNLTLMELGQEYIPVHKHWRLNERSYGDLGEFCNLFCTTAAKKSVSRCMSSFCPLSHTQSRPLQ